jgi:hypothetical protein
MRPIGLFEELHVPCDKIRFENFYEIVFIHRKPDFLKISRIPFEINENFLFFIFSVPVTFEKVVRLVQAIHFFDTPGSFKRCLQA